MSPERQGGSVAERMQTFLPYEDFARSARVLDYRRLGEQRVEAYQILRVLLGQSTGPGWRNHPAVKMWQGSERRLVEYALAMCREWIGRGYRDSMSAKIEGLKLPRRGNTPPAWLGNPRFHRSHRSNLLRKHPEYYRRFWPRLRDDLPYVWPAQ
jgi:hypothetical protein